MEDLNEKLKLSADIVKMSKDISAFKSFLESYVNCEVEHINSSLSKEDFPDIRSASLCYEAMATVKGLLGLISGDKT